MKALSKTLRNSLGFLLATSVLFAAFAAAATLALGSTSLSAGNATVTACGAPALAATRDVDNSGNVTQVTVSGIPAACAGETLSVTLVGSGGSALASLSSTVSGTTASFTSFGSTISASNLTGYQFAVTG
jgi:uncharacterized Zn-binding protein involved in type VI secretion